MRVDSQLIFMAAEFIGESDIVEFDYENEEIRHIQLEWENERVVAAIPFRKKREV